MAQAVKLLHEPVLVESWSYVQKKNNKKKELVLYFFKVAVKPTSVWT